MDFSKLDFELGKTFSAKVFDHLGSQVNDNGNSAGEGFPLLVHSAKIDSD